MGENLHLAILEGSNSCPMHNSSHLLKYTLKCHQFFKFQVTSYFKICHFLEENPILENGCHYYFILSKLDVFIRGRLFGA